MKFDHGKSSMALMVSRGRSTWHTDRQAFAKKRVRRSSTRSACVALMKTRTAWSLAGDDTMKFSIRYVLLVLVLVQGMGASGASFAASFQDTPPGPDNDAGMPAARAPADPQKLIARLTRKLQLTPDQVAKIEPVLQSRQQQFRQLQGDNSLSPHDMHQKMRSIKQGAEQQVLAILSDGQRKQYLLMLQKGMQKWHDKEHGAPADEGADDEGGNP
jgi:protein CpxP